MRTDMIRVIRTGLAQIRQFRDPVSRLEALSLEPSYQSFPNVGVHGNFQKATVANDKQDASCCTAPSKSNLFSQFADIVKRSPRASFGP